MIGLLILTLVAQADPDRVPEVTPADADRRLAITQDAVREMLDRVWNARPGTVKKVGVSLISKYRRAGAKLADIQYAYGVALAKDRDWSAAETNFKAVTNADNSPLAWVALSYVHARMGRIEQSLSDAKKAIDLDPADPLVVRHLATLLTFLTANPTGKFRPDDARDLEVEIFPVLPPDSKDIYTAERERTERYLDAIPTIERKLEPPIASLADDAEKARKEADEHQEKFDRYRAEYDGGRFEFERMESRYANDLVALDQLIAMALRRNDSFSARAYQTERIQRVQQHEEETRQLRRQLADLERELTKLDSVMREIRSSAESLSNEESRARALLAELSTLIPSPWKPTSERRRLLGEKALADKPDDPAPDAEAEFTAETIYSMAETLWSAGSTKLADEYYRMITEEYSGTQAARDAKQSIANHKNVSDRSNPSQKKSKRTRGE